jgi:hypothetical protein
VTIAPNIDPSNTLMSHDRNMEWLNIRRIIYVKHPWSDEPTKVFSWGWYYENGTHQCYELFRSRAKINTMRSLKWHMLVLRFLNRSMSYGEYLEVCYFLIDKRNNFITISVPSDLLLRFAEEVFKENFCMAPKNKMRKVIFKIGTGLSTDEKLSIVGSLVGRSKKITEGDIYQCMLEISDKRDKITIGGISKLLSCTPRTIHRNMGEELKVEKDVLNKQL